MNAIIPTTTVIAIAAFLIGCAGPIIYAKLIFGIQRLRGTGEKASIVVMLFSLTLSLGLCSAGLVYLSKFSVGAAPIIAVAFMIGLGLVRWLRNET